MACNRVFGFFTVLIFSFCYGLDTEVANGNADYTSLVQSLNQLNKKVDNLMLENAVLKQNFIAMRDNLTRENLALKQDIASRTARLASFDANYVAFTAALSPKTTELAQNQLVRFDHVITNAGNGYDARLGHFTAPTAGIYMFSISVMSLPSQYLQLQLVKNGNEVGRAEGDTQGYDTTTVVVMVELNVGDAVWVKRWGTTATESIYGNLWSYFTGCLITSRY